MSGRTLADRRCPNLGFPDPDHDGGRIWVVDPNPVAFGDIDPTSTCLCEGCGYCDRHVSETVEEFMARHGLGPEDMENDYAAGVNGP